MAMIDDGYRSKIVEIKSDVASAPAVQSNSKADTDNDKLTTKGDNYQQCQADSVPKSAQCVKNAAAWQKNVWLYKTISDFFS